MARSLFAPLTALLICGLASGPAGAAPASLRVSEGGGATFPARALVLSLPKRSSLPASQVHVSEDGKPVTGAVVTPLASAGAHDFGVVLAIDVSPSMRGAPLEHAMAAARALAARWRASVARGDIPSATDAWRRLAVARSTR